MSIDVIKLAEQAGFRVIRIQTSQNDSQEFIAPSHATDCTGAVKLLTALVLEEAAKECDEEYKRARFNMDVDIPKNRDFWNGAAIFADQLGEAIRALKPQE